MWTRLSIVVDPKADKCPSEQLAEQVRLAIAAGSLVAGQRLPSVRQLAQQALVNPNTVGKVWRELEREGVLETRPGDGVFVAPAAREHCLAVRDLELRAELERWVAAARAAGLSDEQVGSWFERARGRVASSGVQGVAG